MIADWPSYSSPRYRDCHNKLHILSEAASRSRNSFQKRFARASDHCADGSQGTARTVCAPFSRATLGSIRVAAHSQCCVTAPPGLSLRSRPSAEATAVSRTSRPASLCRAWSPKQPSHSRSAHPICRCSSPRLTSRTTGVDPGSARHSRPRALPRIVERRASVAIARLDPASQRARPHPSVRRSNPVHR